ncbi:MAG: hypothetical protein ACLVCI_05755 [Varibaculum timonense]|nr:hypothetical protein [Varibaculum sp.]
MTLTPFTGCSSWEVIKAEGMSEESLGKPLGLMLVGVAATFEAFSCLR